MSIRVLVDQQDVDPRAGKPEIRRREVRKIRYTTAEWARIVERARVCGKPPARYVREISLGSTPRTRSSQANAELIRELGRIGTALAGLARTARETGEVACADSVQRTLAEILAVVRRLD